MKGRSVVGGVRLACVLLVFSAGCHEVEPDDTGPGSACGDVTLWDVSIRGTVLGPGGGAAAGALVALEDRGYVPGTVHGTAVAGPDGVFDLHAIDVVSVEDCWGTLLNYALVGEDGASRGEKSMNPHLYGAIDDGSLLVDITQLPLRLE